MTDNMSPQVIVPGARRAYATDELGREDPFRPLFDKKGRPLWHMPRPVRRVPHFRNAACRARWQRVRMAAAEQARVTGKPLDMKFLEGVLKECVKAVPVYRGIPTSIAHSLRSAARRRARRIGPVGRAIDAAKTVIRSIAV